MNMTMRISLSCALAALAFARVLAGIPLPEHPRPDWERAEWLNLNGEWAFAPDKQDAGRKGKWFEAGDEKFPMRITVPYGWASAASGVKGCEKVDIAWYRRLVKVPKEWKGRRVFVVVGASDRATDCWFDGQWVGRYSDGYTPFELEITHCVKWGEEQPLVFRVDDTKYDWVLYGKQGYGDCRGIWQTVYLEARAQSYLDHVHFTPDVAHGVVRAKVVLDSPARKDLVCTFAFRKEDRPEPFVLKVPACTMEATAEIALPKPRLWNLDDPYLYELEVSLSGGERVKTYFGMREFSVVNLPGTEIPYVALNGKPVYLRMALDQGFHPDGLYTWPSDDFMRSEIMLPKRLGLNGLREHIKVELPRKLYWADRLGVLLQADVPNWWGEPSPEGAQAHRFCLEQMVRRDYNHPSIFSWLLFNELWGLLTKVGPDGKKQFLPQEQRLQARAYMHAKRLDPTRLVEDDHCHVVTDINSWHGYLPWYRWESKVADAARAYRAGSRSNYADGHVQGKGVPMMNSECGNVWGYKGSAADSDWSWDYHAMMNAFRRYPECSGWMYTEHHDVINEWHGYVRFDRTRRFTGIEELFPGMRLNDLHADVYLVLPTAPGRFCRPNEEVSFPIGISTMTSSAKGLSPSLEWRLRYLDSRGNLVETPPERVSGFAPLGEWRFAEAGTVRVRMPDGAACGTVNFTLVADGKTLARNFACFATGCDGIPLVRPVASRWSQKGWEEADGEKQCGTGKGYFEYRFAAPEGPCLFIAEVSAKKLNGKDVGGLAGGAAEWESVRGGGWRNPSNHPNSYAMTDEHVFPGEVKVYANGDLLATVPLADDPADHRGILSWLWQRQDYRLVDAGSYGYLVKVAIPASAMAKCRDGMVTVRLETEANGLAVYGPRFGRYPFGPGIVR